MENNGGCDGNATCENQIAAPPLCNCNDFYEGDGINCNDINECLVDNGGCDDNATCENQVGAVPTCECNNGYIGDGFVCEDIDECLDNNGGCDDNATCINQLNAVPPLCECNEFYQGDGFTCEDINECLVDNGGCDDNATCENQIGLAPICTCNEGFVGNGRVCSIPAPLNLNEIGPGDLVITELMADPDVISDNDGEWFEIYNTTTSRIDLNGLVVADASGREFTVNNGLLVQGDQDTILNADEYVVFARKGDVNVNGGVVARFDYLDNFSLNNSDETLIISYQTIIFDVVSYASAPQGASWSFDGARAPDATENDDAQYFCAALSSYEANNLGTPGQTNDECPPCDPGYELDANDVCVDIDECLDNNGGCDINATCENQLDAVPPLCTCNDGYQGDGFTCEDVNECLVDNGGCHENATCENQIGAPRTCSCNDGYQGDGFSCENIDECLINNGGCDQECFDEIGSYRCECRAGYTLNEDGLTCDDIDECLIDNGGCDPVAICENQIGDAPFCTCPPQTIGDGLTCRTVDPNPVDFCRLQFPASETVEATFSITVYGRLYEPGLTDFSGFTDEAEEIIGEAGYGPVGSDPYDSESGWQWEASSSNLGYDGFSVGTPDEDEYVAYLSVNDPGNYDYAFRFSVDAGQTWTVCDLDGSGTFAPAPNYGYSSDKAGELEVIE